MITLTKKATTDYRVSRVPYKCGCGQISTPLSHIAYMPCMCSSTIAQYTEITFPEEPIALNPAYICGVIGLQNGGSTVYFEGREIQVVESFGYITRKIAEHE